jgi:HD-GYP domain-containing protein (c-di-GMP phosphodiesterase class II)
MRSPTGGHGRFRSEVIVATIYEQQSRSKTSESQPPFGDFQHNLPSDALLMLRSLEAAFSQSFTVIDCATGTELKSGANFPRLDLYTRLSACEQIARRGRPEILDEVPPLLILAVPLLPESNECPLVAVGAFLTQPVATVEQVTAAASAFQLDATQTLCWAQEQSPWPPRAILEVAVAIVEKTGIAQSSAQLKRQLADISSHLLMTFEEITLLHRLTEQLSISKSVTEICSLCVNWLADVIPAKAVAIWFESISDSHAMGHGSDGRAVLISHGDCPLDQQDFAKFLERLGPRVASEPIVLNRGATGCPTWFYPNVRELISVPIREGTRGFGWLVAINHNGGGDITNSEAEFGTVEACLMASVATILGIHCGNIALYREQSEFFASVVRALTSAIDAKDPYTCGHSDRVARLSVCLAQQLGCDNTELNTIYLSGLLHDIGKIGIDDNVLRKPGPLTPEEFDHIKTHPDLGCRILDGVKQLDNVMPIVRHHHEAWNGSGYPGRLKGDETPFLARIVAVADSIDAMSSDRPYRKGIPDDKLDAILRDGAGKQWDPQIIDAAFRVRDELRRIGKAERNPLSLNVKDWQAEPASQPGSPIGGSECANEPSVEQQHKYRVATK